jgi:NAD(P)-dependent dehydrogenase (short-subunit alcohol dehydrogenase family)
MKDFAGKTVFITGGAGGIGLAMARAIGAIEARRLFVFTRAETRAAVERCHELLLQALTHSATHNSARRDSVRNPHGEEARMRRLEP